jgi:formamidopyrimidine-DNA glycosylase
MVMELPELEVWRRELERELATKKVDKVEVTNAKWLTDLGSDVEARVKGAKLTAVDRLGSWLIFRFNNDEVLAIRPSESLQVRKAVPAKAAKGKNAAAVEPSPEPQLTISPSQGSAVAFSDVKDATRAVLVPADELVAALGDVADLGFDVVADPVSWVKFGEALIQRPGKLKAVLMDPTFLVGLGPAYSDEVLFASGLMFSRQPNTLSAQEIRRLYRAVVETMHDAVKYGGTTLADDDFKNLAGERGNYAQYLAVYKRDGQPSHRSRGKVVKARFGSSYTYYCESTQM